jgi:hypothetical protein
LLADKLTAEDWEVIVTYITILKPCKLAIMKLQGHVNSSASAKGAIWQVLPVLGELMKGLEEAWQRHRPAEAMWPPSPLPTQPPARPTNTRRRQREHTGRTSASALTTAVSSEGDIATSASQQASNSQQTTLRRARSVQTSPRLSTTSQQTSS